MPADDPILAGRVQTAQGDAWQAEGRLRERQGGGAVELPGVRLMASGLPHAQWNSGDVVDPAAVDLGGVRAWYAARAVPWGLRLAAGAPWSSGRFVFRKRCMGLVPVAFRPVKLPPGVSVRIAGRDDLDMVTLVDAASFGGPVERTRRWIAPRLGAPGFTVLLAELDGEPVGVATSIRTGDRAGPCAGVFAVGVLAHARRRGIGSALTSWLVARELAAGTTLAHLNPDTDDAARIYARLGFVETAGFDVYIDV